MMRMMIQSEKDLPQFEAVALIEEKACLRSGSGARGVGNHRSGQRVPAGRGAPACSCNLAVGRTDRRGD